MQVACWVEVIKGCPCPSVSVVLASLAVFRGLEASEATLSSPRTASFLIYTINMAFVNRSHKLPRHPDIGVIQRLLSSLSQFPPEYCAKKLLVSIRKWDLYSLLIRARHWQLSNHFPVLRTQWLSGAEGCSPGCHIYWFWAQSMPSPPVWHSSVGGATCSPESWPPFPYPVCSFLALTRKMASPFNERKYLSPLTEQLLEAISI